MNARDQLAHIIVVSSYNVVTSVTFCGTCVGDRHAARGTRHVTRPAAVSSLITARLLLNTFRDTQEEQGQGRGAGELATGLREILRCSL